MSIVAWVLLTLAAVPLLGLALALVGCWRWRRARLVALRAGSRVALTTLGPVEYAVTGQGPPLLVIHGGMGGYDQALGLGALVNQHAGGGGFTVLAPSRPGYLRTPLQAGRTPEEQADLLATLLDHLSIEKVGVLAGSYGGPFALQFVLRHPHRVRALVLLAAVVRQCRVGQQWLLSERALLSRPGALLADLFHWLLYRWARSRPLALVRAFMRRMTASSVSDAEIDRRAALLSRSPEQVRALQATFCSMTPMSLQMAGSLNDEKQIACLPDYALEDVLKPTLLVHGRDDCVGLGLAGAEWAASKLPAAELLVVEECGHFMLAGEFLSPVFSAVAQFLRRYAPPWADCARAPATSCQETSVR